MKIIQKLEVQKGYMSRWDCFLRMAIGFCAVCTAVHAAASIVINEIHYHPDLKTEHVDFIELFNAGTNAVDLSGWYFSDGVSFTFPNGTFLAPGGYLVVAQDPAGVQSKFGASALGPWTGALNNEGERIVLRNAAGGIENEVDYQQGFPWPTVGDSPGYSIELVNPSLDNNLGANWRASVAGNPTQQSQTLIPDHSPSSTPEVVDVARRWWLAVRAGGPRREVP